MSNLRWLTDEERAAYDSAQGCDLQVCDDLIVALRSLNAEREARELDARGYNAKLAVAEQLYADLAAAEAREKQLRDALAAYRSAIRSGEPETEQLRTFGDEALASVSGQTGSEKVGSLAERLRKLKPIQIGRVDQGETFLFMPEAVQSLWPELCAVVEAGQALYVAVAQLNPEWTRSILPEWNAQMEALAALARRMDEEGL
jgi:hypothetical protein